MASFHAVAATCSCPFIVVIATTAHVCIKGTRNQLMALEETLNVHGVMNFPGPLYNMNKTVISLDPHPPNIIAK